MIEARRPDIIVVDKKEHKGLIIDIAVPPDVNVGEKIGKSKKILGLKERDWKIAETQTCRSCACSDRSSRQYHQRVGQVD